MVLSLLIIFVLLLAISLTVSSFSAVISDMWPGKVNWHLIWVMCVMFLSEDWCFVGICLVSLPPLENMQVPILKVFKSEPFKMRHPKVLAHSEILCSNIVPLDVLEGMLLFWYRSELLQILCRRVETWSENCQSFYWMSLCFHVTLLSLCLPGAFSTSLRICQQCLHTVDANVNM